MKIETIPKRGYFLFLSVDYFHVRNKNYMKNILPALMFFHFIYGTATAQHYPLTFHKNENRNAILQSLLQGRESVSPKGIQWKASQAQLLEMNGNFGDGFLYSQVDTIFKMNNNYNYEYVFFYTTSFVNVEGEGWQVANSCHACGVTVGYFILGPEGDSVSVKKLNTMLTTSGTFGEPSYDITVIDLGAGYELTKIDDPYSGNGINTVSTSFYFMDEQVLSFVSEEDNSGMRDKNEKGYYEFNTKIKADAHNQKLILSKTGFEINETTCKRVPIAKNKTINFEGYTVSF